MNETSEGLEQRKGEVRALASATAVTSDTLPSLFFARSGDIYVGSARVSESLITTVVVDGSTRNDMGASAPRVLEVSFTPVEGSVVEVSANPIRLAPLGAVIDSVIKEVRHRVAGSEFEGPTIRFDFDGDSVEFPMGIFGALENSWMNSERGRTREQEDWDALAEAYLTVVTQGVKSPAKFLAKFLDTTPAVMSNRFSKARKLAKLGFLM